MNLWFNDWVEFEMTAFSVIFLCRLYRINFVVMICGCFVKKCASKVSRNLTSCELRTAETRGEDG